MAEYFGKRHDHVIRDIDNIIAKTGSGGVATFGEAPYIHPQNGQTYRSYDMDRDAFTILAMGFTGKKAMAFKIRYVQAFNDMEKLTQKQATLTLPDFSNPADAARAWADLSADCLDIPVH